MIGDLTGLRALKGIGAASAASPLPKVFSDVAGLETFASEFVVLYTVRGRETELPITPDLYARLRGPYNRRNVYGAALSYAPRLPEPLWQSVYCYALASNGPLRRELGVPSDASAVRVRIRTRTAGRAGTWLLDPRCSE